MFATMSCCIYFLCRLLRSLFLFFFFNDTATTEIYTLSLHDALPISARNMTRAFPFWQFAHASISPASLRIRSTKCVSADRKSTRLNSSHGYISYAVFCLKKKKKQNIRRIRCREIQQLKV